MPENIGPAAPEISVVSYCLHAIFIYGFLSYNRYWVDKIIMAENISLSYERLGLKTYPLNTVCDNMKKEQLHFEYIRAYMGISIFYLNGYVKPTNLTSINELSVGMPLNYIFLVALFYVN